MLGRSGGGVSRSIIRVHPQGTGDARLTLVQAPAGYGKTALLHRWPAAPTEAQETAQRVLVAGAVDEYRFRRILARQVGGSPADAAPVGRDVAADAGLGDALRQRLLAASDARPLVLAIDDADRTAPRLIADLVGLLAETDRVHIVLSGRRRIDLPLGVVPDHEIDRIGAADLAFDRGDVAALAEAAGLSVKPVGIDAILKRSEGWPAGAARLLAAGDHTRIRLTDPLPETIRAFVERRILADLTGDLAEYLLAVSGTEVLDAEAVEAVCDTDRGQVVIDRLVAGGVDLRPIDRARQQWRLHPMVRSIAAEVAVRDHPGGLPTTLRRAGRRALAEGQPVKAMQAFAFAGDGVEVVRTAVVHLAEVAAPDVAIQARALVDAVSPQDAAAVGFGQVTAAFLHRITGDERGAEAIWTAIVDHGSPTGLPADLIDARMRALGIGFGRSPDDVIEAVDRALAIEASIGTGIDGMPMHRLLNRDVVAVLLHSARAEAHLLRGEHREAEHWLRRGANRAIDELARAVLAGVEAAIAIERGEVRRALDLAAGADAAVGDLRLVLTTVDPRLTLAACRLVTGDAEGADRLGAEVADGAVAVGASRRQVQAVTVRVAAGLSLGRLRPALRLIADLRALALPVAPLEDRVLATLEIRLLAALGRPDTARAALHATGLAPAIAPIPHVALACHDRDAAALARVVDAWPHSDAPSARILYLTARVHLANLRNQRGALRSAVGDLAGLVMEDGYLQPAVDLAEGLAGIVDRVVDDESPSVVLDLQRRLAADGTSFGRRDVRLSERELDVLDGIAELWSEAELAARLGVSANTIKTLQRRLYRKLAVNSKGAAVRRAEELGILLPRPRRRPRVD